jgi:PIN domain nuclease of toxin-antitoxin system
MADFVLDASAVVALLLGEPGSERVAGVAPSSALSTANYAEIVGYFARRGIDAEAVARALASFDIGMVELDASTAAQAGTWEPITRRQGLSLGDRCCLALAARQGAAAMTADRAWREVAATLGVTVETLR